MASTALDSFRLESPIGERWLNRIVPCLSVVLAPVLMVVGIGGGGIVKLSPVVAALTVDPLLLAPAKIPASCGLCVGSCPPLPSPSGLGPLLFPLALSGGGSGVVEIALRIPALVNSTL